jgi:Fe-S-cluster containining protein
MTEIRSAFSPMFNETGFEARLDWHVSRREFAENVKRLFEELRSHKAAFPLPVPASTGTAACLLAGIDCKGCPGLCCTRSSKHVSLFPSEAVRLGVKGTPDSQGQIPLPLPCQFLRKGQCSVYAERPAHCRLYPVQTGGSGQGTAGQEVIVGLDSYCPEALRLGLRVYMTSYDLAHGLKSL